MNAICPSIIEMIELMLAPPAPIEGQDPIVVCVFSRNFARLEAFSSIPYVRSGTWTFMFMNPQLRILHKSKLPNIS